jgi:hypothetical protein
MLANSQMKEGRFLKLAKGRKLYRRMNECWDRGGLVRIGTATRYSDFQAKHRERIKLGASGSLYMSLRGTRFDCIDFCTFRFTA